MSLLKSGSLAALAALSLLACEKSSSHKTPPPPPLDPAQLNFEGGQFTTWNTAGAYLYDDDYTVQGGSQAITFAQDTSHASAGLASLQISGTMRQNKNGPDYISDARIYLNSDKAVVDFTGKAITAHFYVQSGTVDSVQVILNDSSYRPCQGKYIPSTASGAWQTVSFDPSDASQVNVDCGAFDITRVAFAEVRVSSGAAPASAAVVWNVDSISWGGGSPPLFSDTGLLLNGSLEGDNTDRWGIYDNAGAANFTGGSPVDCTADGFTGKCLKGSADHFFGAQLYDAAVYLNDGTGTSHNLFVTLAPGTYKVTFKAKASQAAKAHVVMQTAGFDPSLAQDLDLGTSLQTYESDTFEVAASVDLSFAIQLGFAVNGGATLEFDDFALLKKN